MSTWIAPHSVDSVGSTLGSQWLVQSLPALSGRVGASVSACFCHWRKVFPSGRSVLGNLLSLDLREHFHTCRPRGTFKPLPVTGQVETARCLSWHTWYLYFHQL